jgi:pyruvate/2-oxoacid:ferredoxin oxidoreductase alpha subunit
VHRRQAQEAFDRVPGVYREVQAEFQKKFGRPLADLVVPYQADDAEVLLVSMGTLASTMRRVVDQARGKGLKVGSLRLRMFRPFPREALTAAFAGKKRIAIFDRNLCPGLGGITWAEAKGCASDATLVQNYIVGIGGGDVRPAHLSRALEDLMARTAPGAPQMMEVGS